MKFRRLTLYMLTIGIGFFSAGCQKQDHAYRDFIADGERIYIGKVTDLEAKAGNGRVKLSWTVFDSRVKTIKIKFNDDLDSVMLNLNKTDQIDYMETIISDLDERTYTFKVYALDGKGNQSVVKAIDGQSFGANYQSTLNNRIITGRTISGVNTTINWVSVNTDSNIEETEIEYYDLNDGSLKTEVMPKSSTSVTLTNIDTSKGIRYRTKYYPMPNAIDYFFSDYSSYYF